MSTNVITFLYVVIGNKNKNIFIYILKYFQSIFNYKFGIHEIKKKVSYVYDKTIVSKSR